MPEFDPEPILRVLNEHGVRYVVVGAIAAIAQGYPLNTGDLDLTPSRDPNNLERLARALQELDARLRTPTNPEGVDFPIEPDYLGQVDSWTLTTSHGSLDLLFRPAGTRGFEDLHRASIVIEVGGRETRIAALLDIIRMKEAAGRPKDLAQLPALRQTLEISHDRDRRPQS
ncbi:MAG: hypothetical protein AABM30_08380 [Actinomycetota bacterium]